jgi:hypothetical protein
MKLSPSETMAVVVEPGPASVFSAGRLTTVNNTAIRAIMSASGSRTGARHTLDVVDIKPLPPY